MLGFFLGNIILIVMIFFLGGLICKGFCCFVEECMGVFGFGVWDFFLLLIVGLCVFIFSWGIWLWIVV